MKALISPNETFVYIWISSWTKKYTSFTPVHSEIFGCQRVAEVKPDEEIFEVAQPLHWVSCPDECVMDEWYYKDGQCFLKPQNEPPPTTSIEELP
jgi:hypothetical protein